MSDKEKKITNPLWEKRKEKQESEKKAQEDIQYKRKLKHQIDPTAPLQSSFQSDDINTPSKTSLFEFVIDIYPIILNIITLLSILALFIISFSGTFIEGGFLFFLLGFLYILLSYGFFAIIYMIYGYIRSIYESMK